MDFFANLDTGVYLAIGKFGKSYPKETSLYRIIFNSEEDFVALLDKFKETWLIIKYNSMYSFVCINLTGYEDFEEKMEKGVYESIFKYCKSKSNSVRYLQHEKIAEALQTNSRVKTKTTQSSMPLVDMDEFAFVTPNLRKIGAV